MIPYVQIGQAARARGDEREALAVDARAADGRRSGAAGLRDRHVERHHGAGRDAEAHRARGCTTKRRVC